MSNEAPKSAVELAMERLRKKDEAAGAASVQVLSDAQKAAIAEARNICEARLAEREILHRSAVATVFDPAERANLEDEYRRDRERLVAERDAKIARARETKG